MAVGKTLPQRGKIMQVRCSCILTCRIVLSSSSILHACSSDAHQLHDAQEASPDNQPKPFPLLRQRPFLQLLENVQNLMANVSNLQNRNSKTETIQTNLPIHCQFEN